MGYLDDVMGRFSRLEQVKSVEKTEFGLAVKLKTKICPEEERDLLARVKVPVLPSDGQYYIGMDFDETPFSVEFHYAVQKHKTPISRHRHSTQYPNH